MENYAIKVLTNEIKLIEECLTNWQSIKYPVVKKECIDKINELKTAIKLIEHESKNTTVH